MTTPVRGWRAASWLASRSPSKCLVGLEQSALDHSASLPRIRFMLGKCMVLATYSVCNYPDRFRVTFQLAASGSNMFLLLCLRPKPKGLRASGIPGLTVPHPTIPPSHQDRGGGQGEGDPRADVILRNSGQEILRDGQLRSQEGEQQYPGGCSVEEIQTQPL